MSIQAKIRKINGKDVTYYYPVISTYKIDKSKTPVWGKGFLKKSDAILEEAKMKKELQKSPYAKFRRSKIPFKEVRGSWIKTRVSKEAATAERDASYCNIYLSVFDDIDIRKITALDIQDWVTILTEKYAPKTIAMAFNLMSQIMKYAVNPLGIIEENPCNSNIQRPAPKRRKIEADQYWSEEQLKYFLNHPFTRKDSYYRMYLIHSSFGMRPGEICGISINDLDFSIRRLTLNHGIDKKHRLTDLKNCGAQRALTIPPLLIPVFQEQIKASNILRSKKDSYPSLFVTNTGNLISPDVYCKHLTKLIRRINDNGNEYLTPITPYGLRHTFATLSIRKGINIKVIAEIMGDSVETVMQNYVHAGEDLSASSLEMFADSILN